MLAEPKKPPAIKRPIITLLTDFGMQDYYVGAMKGVICEINPQAKVIDISHEVPAHDVFGAGFTLRCAYYTFPLHTIHVVVVDPAVGTTRRAILCKTENFYFVAPDNGVLSFIYECERLVGVWNIESSHYFRLPVHPTFHGRDVFAPVAAHLSRLWNAEDLGPPIEDFQRFALPKPQVAGKQMKAHILTADRFGNLATNVEYADLVVFMQQNSFTRFQMSVGGKPVGPMARTYAEGQGEVFVVPGSSGFLEIAANQKSAQLLLGAKRGQECLMQFECSSSYRDYRLREGRGRRVRKGVVVALVLLALVVAGLLGVRWALGGYRSLRLAAKLAYEGKYDEAEARFRSLSGHRLFGRAGGDGLALVALLRGDVAEARRRLAAAGPGQTRFSPLEYDRLLIELLDRGDYLRGEALAEQARARADSPVRRMLHGIALNGLDKLGPAREAMGGGALRSVFERVRRGDDLLLGGVFQDQKVLTLYAHHVRNLAEKERSGRRAYLYDAAGKPLFRLAVKTGEPTRLDSAVRAALFGTGDAGGKPGGLDGQLDDLDRRNRVDTTLDPEVQRAAYDALRRRRGTAVVLAMDGAVLAAAGREDRPARQRKRRESGPPPDPFTTLFETASVCKVPTLVAVLGPADAIEGLLPYRCGGPLVLGGRPLYDWRSHGVVADVDRALAVSCNLVFAQLGSRLGTERTVAVFHDFGFDRDPKDPLACRPLGRLVTAVEGERATAELALGTGAARSTTVGAAAIALAVATGGELHEPYAIRAKTSLSGRVYAKAEPGHRRVAEAPVARRVRQAMLAVVDDPEGTGQRARPEAWRLAAKTGTSGTEKTGYDSLLIGFAPADSPRYAFAVHLEDAGRAEWEAAFATKALVDGLAAVEEDRRRAEGAFR